ncbi:unnamed protein product, partial [Tetraodon nigroviridis]
CMVESKYNHSRFIPYKNNIVRFTVDAFLFKGMPYQVSHKLCKLQFVFSTYLSLSLPGSGQVITSVYCFVL